MRNPISELKREVRRAPTNERGRRRYGRDLRARIVKAALAARQNGETLTHIAADLGMRPQVLSGWRRKAQDPGAVRTVEVIDDRPVAATGVNLRLPSGATVVGLSLDDVTKLLQQTT